jgi:hypothetical protein
MKPTYLAKGAKQRLLATAVEETIEDNGTSFDLLMDGHPNDEKPVVQKLTKDDGGVETSDSKLLLMDDLPTEHSKWE